ncbi:MAG: lipid II flippase Amj family protein, partial [Peptococcaceae bacterium]|nr:lipid II flippase Amj family protein [Peptococcaceae bacterium]
MDRLLFVFLLTAFINLINTLTRSSRLAGVRTGLLATAISLFGVVYLAASFANTLQAPLLASTVENIIDDAYSRALLEAPPPGATGTPVYQAALADLNGKLRLVILGATAGTVAGILAIPSFVASFANAIKAFGQTGSVFRVALMLLLSPVRPGGGILRLRLTSAGTI